MVNSWLAAASALLFVLGAGPTTEDARPVAPEERRVEHVDPALPTLFLVGDSTMNSSGTNPESGRALRGWASEVGAYFDRSRINVINRAIGGRSSKTFILEGRWDRVLGEMKKGDFAIVQFGHNDAGKWDDPAAKWRPSLRGEGDESQELTKPDGTKETIHSFGWYMRKYVDDAKAKGATVILASMVPHKAFERRGERETFVRWTKNAAEREGALFIDINETIAGEYARVGKAKVEDYFADKGTHTTVEGAKVSAMTVVRTLKGLEKDPLAAFYNAEGATLEPVRGATTQP